MSSGPALEFLARYLADREGGRERELAEYLAMFPGAEEEVAREFLALEGTATAGPASLTVSGEDSVELPIQDLERRYRELGLLGRGGMGEVHLAHDATLGRRVAIKFTKDSALRSEALRDALLREARTVASLSHPNIPPVHDLGIDEKGRVFYVMREIRGATLRDTLDRAWAGDTNWSPPRLLGLFQQACRTMDYAHSRGVVHLDLKPANILTGEFGELYIIDWGISHSVEESEPSAGRGAPEGTPAYMSPEQAKGHRKLGVASDVFSLGVILYEIVTGERAFTGSSVTRILERVAVADYTRGERWRGAPAELREICGKALRESPRQRFGGAGEISEAIQEYLEGTKEKERRQQAANRALQEAEASMAEHRRRISEARRLDREGGTHEPPSWSPVREKRRYWELEEQRRKEEEASERAWEEATLHLVQAHRELPDDPEIRRLLGKQYWKRFERAEERGDSFQQSFLADQLRQLSLLEIDRSLQGNGALVIHCDPPAQRAVIRRYREKHRILRLTPTRELETRPVSWDGIPMGSWQVKLERKGYRPIVAPVHIGRCQEVELCWRFRRDREIGEGFQLVPEGPYRFGGDRDTVGSRAAGVTDVPEFCMAEFPVTVAEYVEFLEDLYRDSPRRALSRVPRVAQGGRPHEWIEVEGGVHLSRTFGKRANPKWPVFGVSWHDARNYARWRSQRDGRRYRLASDDEWEKAARGVDGRLFPWGNQFDAAFCKMVASTEERAQPEPIGRYRNDVSPYGVRDLAGGMKDWCRSWFSRQDGQRLVRGGSWNHTEIGSHCAYRNGCPPKDVYPFIGFRLVHHFGG